jgi:hypothetical protein
MSPCTVWGEFLNYFFSSWKSWMEISVTWAPDSVQGVACHRVQIHHQHPPPLKCIPPLVLVKAEVFVHCAITPATLWTNQITSLSFPCMPIIYFARLCFPVKPGSYCIFWARNDKNQNTIITTDKMMQGNVLTTTNNPLSKWQITNKNPSIVNTKNWGHPPIICGESHNLIF